MYQALYRKYRPRDFDEVAGQEQITTVLKNEMATQKIAHAYLFTGSRGTGKTSCAKIVSKAVNCLAPRDGNPCGECDNCRGIDEGSILDVVEIDAASNNGVDNIRDLRDEAAFTPAVAKYRVYIIDEVHMLSTSAFNALLKILEEPPEHVIFILATTEIQKVLPTIISRCQRFDFRRIESRAIADRLLTVAGREGLSLTDEAAMLIAKLSEGGMRDALSLLDVCVSRSEEITADTVTAAAGLAGSEHMIELTGLIVKHEVSALLCKIGALCSLSLEPQRLCEQLVEHYRNLMLVKTVSDPVELVTCLPGEIERLRAQAKEIPLGELMATLSELQGAAARIGKSPIKRAELELSMLRLCEPAANHSAQALLARVERLEAAVRSGLAAAPRNAREKEDELPAETREEPPTPAKAPAALGEREEAAAEVTPFSQWPEVLERLLQINRAVAGMLGGSTAFCDGKRVLIDIQNPVLLDMLKSNDYTKNNIKQAILDVTGRQYGLGPYRRAREQKVKDDPLDSFLQSLDKSENISII